MQVTIDKTSSSEGCNSMITVIKCEINSERCHELYYISLSPVSHTPSCIVDVTSNNSIDIIKISIDF